MSAPLKIFSPTFAAAGRNVLILTPTLNRGGAERWALQLARCVSDVCWTLCVVSDNPDNHALKAEAETLCPVTVGQTACFAALRSADCVISWGLPYVRMNLPGYRGPLIHVSHLQTAGDFGLCAQQRQLNESNQHENLVAVSHACKGGVAPERWQVIYNTVDEDRLRPQSPAPAMRAAWGATAEDFVLLFVGRLEAHKDPHALLRAASAAYDRRKVVCVFAGAGPERENLERFAAQHDLRAQFLGGVDHVGDIMRAASVLVLASKSEGQSLTIAEAWHVGLPVVATDVGAIPEMERLAGGLVTGIPIAASGHQIALAAQQARFDLGKIARAQGFARTRLSEERFATDWHAAIAAATPPQLSCEQQGQLMGAQFAYRQNEAILSAIQSGAQPHG